MAGGLTRLGWTGWEDGESHEAHEGHEEHEEQKELEGETKEREACRQAGRKGLGEDVGVRDHVLSATGYRLRATSFLLSVYNARMDKRFEYQELVFDGRVAKGYKVGLKMDDGRVVPRDYFSYGGAAVILPVLDDGSIVMIRNERFAVNEKLLELPAGMLEKGEDPAEGAGRELIEETGYTAGRIEKLGTFFTGPGTTDENMHAYLATGLTRGEQNLEIYERITVEIYSEPRVRQMIADGTLHDGKSIAALALYWLRKGTM